MFEEDEHTMMVPSFGAGTFFADRYRIDELLGSGAMGRVYRATELSGERVVALKVLHTERLADQDTVSRFEREAEVLASIGHPCIVEVYAFHRTREGVPYLAMELLEGVTLKTRLSQGRFEDPVKLHEIVDGICGALEAAHARGVVHRDLKPDNIFLPATGVPRAKLVDFGLSRIAKADKSLTHSGMILGTPRYMPPEQIRDASAAGPEGDLYSFGVIVYEALSGESPYPAQDYGQLLGCLMEGRITPFAQRRPDLPALAPVIDRALAQDPAHRYPNAGALADAFGAAIGRPSRRREVAAAARRVTPDPARARMSHPSPVPSRSSTLAFDPAAGRELIAAIEAAKPDFASTTPEPPALPGPPPGVPSTRSNEVEYMAGAATNPEVRLSDMSSASTSLSDSITDPDHTAPTPAGQVPLVAHANPPPPRASVPEPAHSSSPSMPAQPSPYAATPSQPPARGGDTMFLGEGVATPSFAPAAAAQTPAPTPSFAPGPPSRPSFPQHAAPAPPPKKSYLGYVLFLVAVLVVVVVSSIGGFILRAYINGAL